VRICGATGPRVATRARSLFFIFVTYFTVNPPSRQVLAGDLDRVEIVNFAFGPAAITVKQGTKLTFTNRDRVPHAIIGEVEGREIFRSPEQIDEDEAFAVVLDKPGEIVVRCGLHSNMKSKVTVTP
jgi:plastocyanin